MQPNTLTLTKRQDSIIYQRERSGYLIFHSPFVLLKARSDHLIYSLQLTRLFQTKTNSD